MTRAMIDAPTDSAAPRLRDYGHDLEFGVFIEPAARSADQVVALSRTQPCFRTLRAANRSSNR